MFYAGQVGNRRQKRFGTGGGGWAGARGSKGCAADATGFWGSPHGA